MSTRSAVTNHKDLLPGLDGRSATARRFRDLVNAFIADMGGLDCVRRSGSGCRARSASGEDHPRLRRGSATALPLFLFALPAGALGDIVDRRIFLIVAEGVCTTIAAVFAAIVWSGLRHCAGKINWGLWAPLSL
jgi:hypothetical protein